jgi:GTP pyrophosphokinase
MDANDALDRAYEALSPELTSLGGEVARIVSQLLDDAGLRTHSVDQRVKSLNSLRRKIGEKGSKYGSLSDVHDLLGIRIITFFPDEVDAVAQVIEREFAVDPANSVDKRAALDPDRFGYLSLHYVAALSPQRAQLTELKRFADQRFEIQIRSILQHAWAEIEHDLGYRDAQAVPRSILRRFSMLAGLLEMADAEFERLRDEVSEYQQVVRSEVVDLPQRVSIDRDSVMALIRTDELVQELDVYLLEHEGIALPEDEGFGASVAVKLRSVGLETVADVTAALGERKDTVRTFIDLWLGDGGTLEVAPGLSLFYLAYVMVGETRSFERALEYVDENNLGPEPHDEVAQLILDTWAEAAAKS